MSTVIRSASSFGVTLWRDNLPAAEAKMPNIFANIPDDLPEELVEVLCKNSENSDLRIKRIVSRGQSSPEGFWYDSDKNEWVILLKGSAAILFEDNPTPLELLPGD